MARFKENANMFSIADPMKAPMMHGHTCIELRDVKTGKRERVESDNTFMATTLSRYMRGLGQGANSPYNSDSFRANTYNNVRCLCGGVFLFKDAIPDGAEYMNAGNKMTANGCYNIVNNGNPPEFGSWNSIESNIDGNSSAVLVWDWSTSQGNGQISSVCLTSETGGYIGYGNASGYRMSTGRDFGTNQYAPSLFKGLTIKKFYNDLGIQFTHTSPNLTITKYRVPINKASIFDGKIKQTRVIDLSTYNLVTNNLGIINIEHDKAMIFENKDIANNETFTWLLYNYADDSIQTKSVVNTTGVTLQSWKFLYLEDEGKYVVTTSSTPYYLYILNETTGAIIDTIDTTDIANNNMIYRFKNNLLYYACFHKVIDLVNKTSYLTNNNSINYVQNNAEYVESIDAMRYASSSTPRNAVNFDYGNLIKNPLYLATINNLQESVTKQNTQTMKVTYTLTEV